MFSFLNKYPSNYTIKHPESTLLFVNITSTFQKKGKKKKKKKKKRKKKKEKENVHDPTNTLQN